MDAKPKTRWYQVSLGRFLLTAMLISAAGGMFILDPRENLYLALILVIAAIGAWFGHPFWGAFAGFVVAVVLIAVVFVGLETGLIPFAGS